MQVKYKTQSPWDDAPYHLYGQAAAGQDVKTGHLVKKARKLGVPLSGF